jgi:hypothetical protein
MRRSLHTVSILAVLILAFVPSADAEVTRVVMTAKRDVAAGRAFGSVGPYERVSGTIYFAVDPKNRRNQVVADIDKAPRNAAGMVEMSADLVIVRPRDPARSNGIVLFDIVNRGATVVLKTFNGETGTAPETEAGDGVLFTRAATKADRERTHDARLSIEERYPSRADYLRRVRQAGDALAKQGYLLADDVPGVIEHAGQHWDLLVGKTAISSTRAGH